MIALSFFQRLGRRTCFLIGIAIVDGTRTLVEEIMSRSAFDGMQTANQALLKLVQDGRVEAEDALAQSLKPNELAQALRGRT